ncbi:MAG TPA: hypothetical protein VF553_21940, partial [Pyrinomonadaceae bacterium]
PHADQYLLRSSVLGGQTIARLYGDTGQPVYKYVYANAQLVTEVMVMTSYPSQYKWHHQNATGNSVRQTGRGGNLLEATELDPLGNAYVWNHPSFPIPEPEPEPTTTERDGPNEPGSFYGTASNPVSGCMVDGVTTPCSIANWFLESGISAPCPNNDCGPQSYRLTINGITTRGLTRPFQALADGWGAYLLPGALYDGGGRWYIPFGGQDVEFGRQRRWRPEQGDFGTEPIGEVAAPGDSGFSLPAQEGNPAKIESDPNNRDCHLSVSFTEPRADGLPTGPGYVAQPRLGQTYGIGFRCLVPQCAGIVFPSLSAKEALWDNFHTAAPARLHYRRRSSSSFAMYKLPSSPSISY